MKLASPKFESNALPKGFKQVIELNPKKFTNLIKVVTFFSDKDSVIATKEILKNIQNCLDDLPKTDVEYDDKKLSKINSTTILNLLEINKTLEFIDTVFNEQDGYLKEIVMDDLNFLEVYKNLTLIKSGFIYIQEYCTLIFSTQQAKKEEQILLPGEQFLNQFDQVAA